MNGKYMVKALSCELKSVMVGRVNCLCGERIPICKALSTSVLSVNCAF